MPDARNNGLFVATVLIWGSTWIAIRFQVGPVPVLVAVFYRFVVAAGALNAALALTGRLKAPPMRLQPMLVAMAFCLFCCNFICFYNAALYVTTGLLSVVFSLASICNAVNARLFFGERIAPRTVIAGLMGVAGLALLFGRKLWVDFDLNTLKGIGFAALGTLSFSLGNMASRRVSAAGVTPVTANAWGMAYGALMLLALILVTGTPIVLPPDGVYVAALLYLGLFATVIGFTAYLTLVVRIGSSRAGYATVLFPIVALAMSTLFEGYRWTGWGLAGVAMCLAGNAVMFTGPRRLRV